MADTLVNSSSLTLADFHAIDIVLADPDRFDELSTAQRCYMQNVARAVPAHADLSGYSDGDLRGDCPHKMYAWYRVAKSDPWTYRCELCGLVTSHTSRDRG